MDFVRPRRRASAIDKTLREGRRITILRACLGPFTFSDAPWSHTGSGISVSNRPTERIIRAHPHLAPVDLVSLATPCPLWTHQCYPPALPPWCLLTIWGPGQPDSTLCPGIPAKPAPQLSRSLNGPPRLTSRALIFVLPSSLLQRSRHQQMLLLVQGHSTNCSAERRIS
ncbi:hypothetical protein DHEL01_v203557 [Diaporthe helianthi]|uniref:Uncharacterized protein n=1 Tax=Diaporthe helianthi TaxID=158607 RepID=A0A2P5I6A1_DIAHE|nr:hypothetical protein DHEL01_v203557 [Diaporthe helianthi]